MLLMGVVVRQYKNSSGKLLGNATGCPGFGNVPARTHGSAGFAASRHCPSCRPFLSRYHLGYPLAGSMAPTAARPWAFWAKAPPAAKITHPPTAREMHHFNFEPRGFIRLSPLL